MTVQERTEQLELMRSAARAAGRDADALEYTRWGSLDMSVEDVADRAAEGVTRLVMGLGAPDVAQQLEALSDFAARHGLAW